jgi:hypothetical protein
MPAQSKANLKDFHCIFLAANPVEFNGNKSNSTHRAA